MSRLRTRTKHQELKRFGQVVSVLVRYGFEDILTRLSIKVKMSSRVPVLRREVKKTRHLSTSQRIRMVLEALGPVYVKFGQMLSGRPDLLPADFISELRKLQDGVAPFPFQDVKAIIEKEFGRPLKELYVDFEKKPSAAASLSQVHHARTKDGNEVAVKVQRPGIAEVIDADISTLRKLAELAERSVTDLKVYRPAAIVDEFVRSIHRELDFVQEGRNADRFREFFQSDETVHVPAVYWNLTGAKVLTLEFIHGTKVSESDRLDALGLDRKAIATNGANLILKEVFDFHRFHADPHPGNLFVLAENVIVPIDFGMIGTLDEESVEHLSQLITAVVDKNAESLAEVLLQMCRTTEPAPVRPIQSELSDLLERHHEVPLQQLDMNDIVGEVTGILRRHGLYFPEELAMVARSLLIIENVGRELYPEFNVFEVLRPFVRKLVLRRYDPMTRFRATAKMFDELGLLMKRLPTDVRDTLARFRNGEAIIRLEHQGLEQFNENVNRSSNRLSSAIVIASLVIGSSIVTQAGIGPKVLGHPLPGLAGFIVASVLGLWLLIGIMKSGQL